MVWITIIIMYSPHAGYGSLAPSTGNGQIFFIFFSLLIPLNLLILLQIGSIIDAWILRLIRKCNKNAFDFSSSFVTLSFMLVYVMSSGVIFYAIEDWNYIQSIYYVVVTITTVGFGDYIPGQNVKNTWLRGFYLFCVCIWIYIGMGLVATMTTKMLKWILGGKSNSLLKVEPSSTENNP